MLTGNPQKRPLPKHEPKPRPVMPECPSWLDSVAKAEWKAITPELHIMGLLTIVDRAALAAYCQSFSEWKAADLVIQEKGQTMPGKTFTTEKRDGTVITEASGEVTRPEVRIRNNARQAMRALLAEFGMSPSARTRIQVKPPLEDDLDKLLAP